MPNFGAVKMPDAKFTAWPTFSRSTSNGIGVFRVENEELLWTKNWTGDDFTSVKPIRVSRPSIILYNISLLVYELNNEFK